MRKAAYVFAILLLLFVAVKQHIQLSTEKPQPLEPMMIIVATNNPDQVQQRLRTNPHYLMELLMLNHQNTTLDPRNTEKESPGAQLIVFEEPL